VQKAFYDLWHQVAPNNSWRQVVHKVKKFTSSCLA